MRFSKFYILMGLVIGFSSYARAESRIVVKFPGNNQIATAQVPAQTASSTPLIFYYVSKGNLTSQIGAEVLGPKGIEASVEAAQIKGSAQATLDNGSFWKVYLTSSASISNRAAIVPASARSVVESAVSVRTTQAGCESLPQNIISLIVANYSQQFGRPVSYEEICPAAGSSLNNQGSGSLNQSSNEGVEIPGGSSISTPVQPQIDQDFGSAHGFIQKDNCSTLKNYLVKITVKLNKVAPEVLSQGFEVKARLQEVWYRGPRAASMKPVSDGMYAPRPLLLMQSIGGGQWVNMVSWARGKPRIITKVAASPSIVYYRGFVLVRIVADKLLAGGRGEKTNFELTNGETIYNICGRRARVRWKVNGYPG